MLTAVDDFMTAADYKALCAHVAKMPLQFGAKSNFKTDPYGHLSCKPWHDKRQNLADIADTISGPVKDAWENVRDHLILNADTTAGWKLIRCYVNAYTYGMDGYFHTDSHRPDELTCILYICDKWELDWAGETMIDLDGKLHASLPRPNRLLIIPANANHCARAVSRMCKEIRTVLVFKARPARSLQFENLSKFLVGRGALSIDHQESTLHDHLVRVYALLEGKQESPEICFGGGLHSIYGTNAFKQKLLEPNAANRSMVATAFGEKAEGMAYVFSLLDRPQTLDRPEMIIGSNGTGYKLKMRYDQHMAVEAPILRALQMIEAANLEDQNSLKKWDILQAQWTRAPYVA